MQSCGLLGGVTCSVWSISCSAVETHSRGIRWITACSSCVLHFTCILKTQKEMLIYYFCVKLKCFMLELMIENHLWYVEINYLFICVKLIWFIISRYLCFVYFELRVCIWRRGSSVMCVNMCVILCLVFYQNGMNAMEWAKQRGKTSCYEFLRDYDEVGRQRSEFLDTNSSSFLVFLFYNIWFHSL